MKKMGIAILAMGVCLSLIGCSGSKSPENDIGKENSTIIESAINEMKGYYVDDAKYQSGNKDEKSATYVTGKCEYTLYTDGKTITKVSVQDKGQENNNSSDDFKNVMNSIAALKSFDFDTDTLSKMVDIYNQHKDAKKNINGYIMQFTSSSMIVQNKTEESLAAAIPITLDNIEMVGFKCLPPDSIGTIYMVTKFKNKSDKVIKNIEYTYTVDGEKGYLGCYDTLMPGETSTKVDTFGPKSGKIKDAQLLKAEITVVEDSEDVYVSYDAKLKEYKWY